MYISDFMKSHQREHTGTKRARVLLIFGILSSLLSVAVTILARRRKQVPAMESPTLSAQPLNGKTSMQRPTMRLTATSSSNWTA